MTLNEIKSNLTEYMNGLGITYLKKSNLADFAIKYNYELEDINEIFNDSYSYDYTIFYERIGDKQYRRYVLDADSDTEIENKTGLKKCLHCGCYSATTIDSADGYHFCTNTCARYCGYEICTECGKLKKITRYGDNLLCADCVELHHEKYNLQKCDKCGKYYALDNFYKVNGKNFCKRCVDDLRLVNGYHYSSKHFKMYKLNREKPLYFGYENEFEIKDDNMSRNVIALGMNEILKENGLQGFFNYETDGSLNTGFEAISQPATLPWLYEHETALQKMYDFMLKNSCTAEKTTTAGLHIHFSRTGLTKQYSLAKIAYLINKLQYDFTRFANRKLNELHYTMFDGAYNSNGYHVGAYDSDGDFKLDTFKNYYFDNHVEKNNHGVVVNTQHNKTIEIRLFKGTLNLKRIIANIELLNNLIYFVENKSDTQIESATFKDICLIKKTKYLKAFYYQIFEPKQKIKGGEILCA